MSLLGGIFGLGCTASKEAQDNAYKRRPAKNRCRNSAGPIGSDKNHNRCGKNPQKGYHNCTSLAALLQQSIMFSVCLLYGNDFSFTLMAV